MDTIRVAQVKVFPKKGAVKENAALLMDVLAELAPAAADVVVTPEAFLDGYLAAEKDVDRAALAAVAIDSETAPETRAVAEWAAAHRAWVVLGCSRRCAAGVRNSALIYNREGALVDIYDKTHLQRHDLKYAPGERLPVWPSEFGPFGVLICADRRWPESVRTLALRGARVIFNPTYGMSCDLNLAMMRTRAYESEVFIVFTHPRQALITDPRGRIVTNCEDDNARFAVTEILLAAADAARARDNSHLRDRRPDLYER